MKTTRTPYKNLIAAAATLLAELAEGGVPKKEVRALARAYKAALADPASIETSNRVLICVDGGLVQTVYTDRQDATVLVTDLDFEGSDREDIDRRMTAEFGEPDGKGVAEVNQAHERFIGACREELDYEPTNYFNGKGVVTKTL